MRLMRESNQFSTSSSNGLTCKKSHFVFKPPAKLANVSYNMKGPSINDGMAIEEGYRSL